MGRLIAWVRVGSNLCLGPGHIEAVPPPCLFTDSVGDVGVGCFTKTALRTLDALFEGSFLGVVQFLFASFRVTKKLERTLVLLVVEIIQTIPQQVASPPDGCDAI
jgi:hypothetical protein